MRFSYKKSVYLIAFAFILPFLTKAQLPDHVGSLLNTERTASYLAQTKSAHEGLSYIIDKESSFYVPVKVNARDYLSNRPNIPDRMSWKPNLVLVSRSKDWGVTLGGMEFQKIGVIKRYGNYLAIWRRDRKGKWKIHLRAEVENYGKDHDENSKPEYLEPDDEWYLKHRSNVRLGQREELVMQSDQLLSSVLKTSNTTAYDEFLEEDARLFFPWNSEIKGKENILKFLQSERLKIETKPESVGRAYSGEYGYTSGTARVFDLNDEEGETKFNYIRIWKLQEDFQWKVMVEFLFER
ncbi:MAG TPA: nuclear transport factor 2 family protein [Sphingobacterium sp.]|nr:nuclear transport factor 2 family protein [Sphingobacterium sp.]